MSRIIDDTTYAEIVKILATDPKVAVFQKLLLSEKVEHKPEEKPADKKNRLCNLSFFCYKVAHEQT